MRPINLDTYSLSLLTAKEDILNQRASTNWALFTYDGITNNLKLSDSGAGGLAELVEKFHAAKPMYGLCSVGQTEAGQPRIILICWVGENVDEIRREECESHVPAVRSFFKEAHSFISASNKEELTEEKIRTIVAKIQPQTERFRRSSKPTEKEETVGTNYRKTNAALEIRQINRDSFWARAEREEEERKEEEKRRAMEDRRRRERERVMQEKKDAEERDRKMNEKLQMIEEQRKIEAQLVEESRRQEKARWELQQREDEEEMRARLRRSESIEKAAEAAALISQRSMNPREFFRQLSSSSLSSTSPLSPRSGKPPFRRYQRSLTDTAFIFERANSFSGPASPLSPSVSSPFSRTPTSPLNRPMSPTSPSFHPIVSPRSPRAPIGSSPTSPPVSSPPTLPVLPASQVSAGLVEIKSPSQHGSVQEPAAIPSAPDAPLPESPVRSKELHTNTTVLLELDPKVDEGVLVEEDEEDEGLPAETVSLPCSENKTSRSCVDVIEPEQAFMPRLEQRAGPAIGSLVEVEEPTEHEQNLTEETVIGSSVYPPEPEALESEEPTLVEDSEDEIEADVEIHVADSKNGVVEEDRPDQNGVYPQNGTAKEYDDSSEHSTPDKCTYIVNRDDSDEEDDIQVEDAPENGESPDRSLLCVRALYDYQAEDDTEISFEPGDIISGVETVDKAWWRGFSKDGRQGLFPSNYVETI